MALLATLSAAWLAALSGGRAAAQAGSEAESPAIIPTPSQTPYAVLQIEALYYDLEGRAGLVHPYAYPTTPTAQTSVFFRDGMAPLSIPGVGAYKEYSYYLSGTFSEFLFEIPGVGDYLGSTYIDCCVPFPYFVIPTTSERLGRTMELRSQSLAPPPNGQAMSVEIYPMVAHSVELPLGYAASIRYAPDSSLEFSVTVEVLPESGREGMTSLSRTLTMRGCCPSYSYDSLFLDWSGYPVIYDYPFVWKVDDMVPTGTLSISIWKDGYTTSTIQLTPSNLRTYDWYPLLLPLPDRPDVFRPGLSVSFRKIPSASMIERMEDITDAILFSVSGPDENQDGSVDVSDILRVLKDGYP